MRVAVVGGSGFVGSHVVDRLMKDGHDVVIMDRNRPNWHPTTMWQELDITNDVECRAAFAGVQVIMHLAAMSNTQMALNDPRICTMLNCVGTVNVLEGARIAGVERVVIAGSTLISGLQTPYLMEWPLDVDRFTVDRYVVDEACAIEPWRSEHPYVTSKVFEEMIARDFMRQYGLPVTVFRYGIQYGERMTPGVVVHSFIERALRKQPLTLHGDGQQWRQYLHVEDVARAHSLVIDNWDATSGGTYNLVPHEKVKIVDIAEAVSKVIPKTIIEYGPSREGDIDVRFCLASAAARDMGWRPEISLEDGIARTVEWYRKHLSTGVKRR